MDIGVYFAKSGIPQVSLSPKITITKASDGVVAVNQDAVINRGSGFYYYKFTLDRFESYFVLVDGGSSLTGASRYKYAIIQPNDARSHSQYIIEATS